MHHVQDRYQTSYSMCQGYSWAQNYVNTSHKMLCKNINEFFLLNTQQQSFGFSCVWLPCKEGRTLALPAGSWTDSHTCSIPLSPWADLVMHMFPMLFHLFFFSMFFIFQTFKAFLDWSSSAEKPEVQHL